MDKPTRVVLVRTRQGPREILHLREVRRSAPSVASNSRQSLLAALERRVSQASCSDGLVPSDKRESSDPAGRQTAVPRSVAVVGSRGPNPLAASSGDSVRKRKGRTKARTKIGWRKGSECYGGGESCTFYG